MQEPHEELTPSETVEANGPEERPVSRPEERPVSRRERVGRSFRRGLRWLVILLVAFGLGFLAAVIALYLPAQQRLQQARQESEGRVTEAQQQVSALETQVAGFAGLEGANQELEAQARQSELHVHILSSRADISAALLALAEEDLPRASAALTKTGDTLAALEGLLEPEQQKLAQDMQERLELARNEMGEDAFAARSDLGVLTNMLRELENAYFAAP